MMGGGRPRRALKSGWGAVRAVAASVAVVREVCESDVLGDGFHGLLLLVCRCGRW